MAAVVGKRRRRRKQMAEMNVVPYIDVMLVLLVIFMVTAPMMQTGVEVSLPDADAKAMAANNQQEPVYITVDEKGFFYLDNSDAMNSQELASLIMDKLEKHPNRQVYIRGDQGVEYSYVMQAMVIIQKAGVKNIGLIAAPNAASSQ
jgi:biopolymer transport protein TolR